MARKTYENAGWGKRGRVFGFEAAKPGTRLTRRMDPNVNSFTRLRDEIGERRLGPAPRKLVMPPDYIPPELPAMARLRQIRWRLRTESMPTRERQYLEQVEAELAVKLGRQWDLE